MQSILRVIMTTHKVEDPGRLQYRQVEGSFQELPTLPVENENK